jgi:hypothetical protein
MWSGYRFAVMGPYRVPFSKKGKRRIDCLEARDVVFEEAEEHARKLNIDIYKAIGCYIFGLCPSGGPKEWPYYVGQSCEQTLYGRVFQKGDKTNTYNAIVKQYQRAWPFVYLLPLLTPEGRVAQRRSNQRIIDHAEHMLIGMALNANFDLWNIKHRVVLDSFSIDGTPQAARRDTKAAKQFRRMLDLHGRHA